MALDATEEDVFNKFKELESTQTPDQLQNTLEDQGINLDRFTGANDSGQGGQMPAQSQVPVEQYRPAETNDYSQPFYSRLERGPDGTLQGVGQGTIYDRQGIAARNLASGQLSSASDLYQEAAGGPVRPQPQLPPSLEQQLALTQLNQFEQAQLTQAQHGLSVISQQIMAGSIFPGTAHRAINAYNSVINPLLHRQTQANELAKHISHRDMMQERLHATAGDIAETQARLKASVEGAWKDPETGLRYVMSKDGTPKVLEGDLHIQKGAGNEAKAMAAQEGAYFKAYYAAVKQADSDMRKLIGKDEKGHDIPFNTEHYAQRDKIVAETLAKHGYAPTWEEQKQKIGGVQGQSQQGISGGVSGATPGGTPAGPQQTAPPAPKPFTKVEAKVADQTFEQSTKEIQAMEGVPAIVKTNAVMAIQGMKDMLKKYNNDPAKFSDEDSALYFHYRKVLEQIRTPKPAPAPTPAAKPVPFYLKGG